MIIVSICHKSFGNLSYVYVPNVINYGMIKSGEESFRKFQILQKWEWDCLLASEVEYSTVGVLLTARATKS